MSAPENVWADPAPPAGHAPSMRGLWRAAAVERLSHALLFSGPRGIGKFTAARWFVRGLFCARLDEGGEAQPCGSCPPCKRLAAPGGHPDLFVIEPILTGSDGSEQLRLKRFVPVPNERVPNAEEFLKLKPVEGGWRVVLVREMERANREAQNAILKMLEEPGEDVLWVLECSRPGALLPTIRSRCVPVLFDPLSSSETRSVLQGCGLGAGDAAALARWSRGSPGVALSLQSCGAIEIRELLRELLCGERAAFGSDPAAHRVWELEGTFVAKTTTGVQRARARFVLDLALALVRDMLSADAGLDPEVLPHGDLVAGLLTVPGGAPRMRHMLDTLLEARRDIDSNVNPVSVLDLAFLALDPPAAQDAGRRAVGAAR